MTSSLQLEVKYQILSRHVASLPSELDAWISRADAGDTLEKNFSQIETLDYFVRDLCKSNEKRLKTLDPTGKVDLFLDSALKLTTDIVKSRLTWDFFRDRLELRFVPQFQKPLLMADLISHDCYTTITDRAEALRIILPHGFREYPLIGLMTQHSPATWPRGWRPPALQNHNLPIAVIDLPWEHLVNPWELVTIAHEVGHDVDEDLGKLTHALIPFTTTQLETNGAPTERISQWRMWIGEVLADLIGILLTGPAFVQVLIGLLTLPRFLVRDIAPLDPHPPNYLRTFINTALLRHLGVLQSANDLETRWKALYGEPGDRFDRYMPDIEPIISSILYTPLPALQDQDDQQHSLSELIAFTPDDQACIQDAAAKLVIGATPRRLPIRHVISASQLAFEQIAETGDVDRIEGLARHTCQTVTNLARPGQLGAGLTSHRTRQHLDDLAQALLERSMEDFDMQWSIAEDVR